MSRSQKQESPGLALVTTDLDLNRLVQFNPCPFERHWQVGPGNKRQGRIGREIGTIVLQHAGAYEVVLQLDGGDIDTFDPLQLFPLRD